MTAIGTPAVTFVIPAHNAEATLSATLHCLVDQTRGDWRAIIVDDNSTDATGRIAESFLGDSRFSLLHSICGGAAAARNFGARSVTTPWLVFLDSDDLITPDYLAEMLAAAERETPDTVYCSGWRLAPDGRMSVMERPPRSDHLMHLHSRNIFYTHAVLLARTRFVALGGFRETLRSCEDWDLWVRLFRSGAKVVEVDRLMTVYRMRPGSLTREARSVLDCALSVIASAYAGSPPADDLVQRRRLSQATLRAWLFGVTAGAGQIDNAMLGAESDVAVLDPESFAGCVVHGAAIGACQFESDWPRLWPALREAIGGGLTEYAGQCAAPFDAAPYLQKLASLAQIGDAK